MLSFMKPTAFLFLLFLKSNAQEVKMNDKGEQLEYYCGNMLRTYIICINAKDVFLGQECPSDHIHTVSSSNICVKIYLLSFACSHALYST